MSELLQRRLYSAFVAQDGLRTRMGFAQSIASFTLWTKLARSFAVSIVKPWRKDLFNR